MFILIARIYSPTFKAKAWSSETIRVRETRKWKFNISRLLVFAGLRTFCSWCRSPSYSSVQRRIGQQVLGIRWNVCTRTCLPRRQSNIATAIPGEEAERAELKAGNCWAHFKQQYDYCDVVSMVQVECWLWIMVDCSTWSVDSTFASVFSSCYAPLRLLRRKTHTVCLRISDTFVDITKR